MAVLTFRHLRELQKTERESVSLCQIDAGFYAACGECLKKSAEAPDSSDAENIQPLIKSILDMRERKIVTFAIQAARTEIKPKNMVSEEEALFSNIITVIKSHRDILEGHLTEKHLPRLPPQQQVQQPQPQEISSSEVSKLSKPETPIQSQSPINSPALQKTESEPEPKSPIQPQLPQSRSPQEQEQIKNGFLRLKAILDIPAFVAEDMKIYGPLRCGECAEVPQKAAEVLISAKSAENAMQNMSLLSQNVQEFLGSPLQAQTER